MDNSGDILVLLLALAAGAATFYRRRKRFMQRMTPAKLLTGVGFTLILAGLALAIYSLEALRDSFPLTTRWLFGSGLLCITVGFAADFMTRKQ